MSRGIRPARAPYYECIAITDSDDATAGGTAYTFLIDDKWFPDYPKFGVWNDAYYMSVHLFGKYEVKGQGIIAFDREAMLQGLPAREIQFFYNPAFFGALPADVSGTSAPEPGTPNFLAVLRDDNLDSRQDQLLLYAFLVNWEAPSYSAILGPAQLEVEPFNSDLCYCIAQKDSGTPLDPIAAGFLMYPMAYRNFGTTDSLVLNHTVKVGRSRAGVRWYEISNPWTDPQIAQQGTVPTPDKLSRWMASINVDQEGNMALGYSISGKNMFPSIATSGRLATDPPGTMGQEESMLVAGQGSQRLNYRWGDYTSMQVDPMDNCTFWYTNEYYEDPKDNRWKTAVAAFKYPGC